MKSFFFIIFILVATPLLAKESPPACAGGPSWYQLACKRLHQVWTKGSNDLYITGYAWHNRHTYSAAKIATYNETAWGGGFGKGLYDERGNWHGLFAFAFLDSHKNIEPAAGYSYLKTLPFNDETNVGLGLSLFVTARSDILNNYPFPGILPWATFTHKRATLAATYIPGAKGAGNVLFIFGKWQL